MTRRTPIALMSALSLVAPAAVPFAVLAGPAQAATTGKLVTGTTYSMKWGAVTVRLRLDAKNKRVVNVFAILPTERPRSAQINGHAAPILKTEVLRAQSANVHAVSGATMTSNAYKASLRTALRKAHI